ncbi:MAG: serine hydrolase domain-containing protein [Candidatus Binatia bacterium]
MLAIAFDHQSPDSGGFDYCNTNTVLLGLIAEQLDGKPLAEILRDRFFAPLGTTETMLPDPDATALPAPRAHGYVYESLQYVFLHALYPPEVQAAARAGTLAPIDFTDVNPSWAWAAGGVVSTARDLTTWIEALAGGRLLDAAHQRAWRDSVQPNDPDQPNGLQYVVRHRPGAPARQSDLLPQRRAARLQHLRRLRSGQPRHHRGVGDPAAVGQRRDARRHPRAGSPTWIIYRDAPDTVLDLPGT